jgi:hypothetical protein
MLPTCPTQRRPAVSPSRTLLALRLPQTTRRSPIASCPAKHNNADDRSAAAAAGTIRRRRRVRGIATTSAAAMKWTCTAPLASPKARTGVPTRHGLRSFIDTRSMNVPLPPDRRDEVRKQTSNIGISIGSERTPTASSLTLLPVLVETWISVAVVLLAISARLFCLLGGCDDAIVSCGFGGSAGCTINR